MKNQNDMALSVSEEINIFMGFDTRVVDNSIIEFDTIAGRMKFSCSEPTIMGNVYRFINHYGLKISNWALENKIVEFQKTFKQ